jgi:signal transduction histidine kinase
VISLLALFRHFPFYIAHNLRVYRWPAFWQGLLLGLGLGCCVHPASAQTCLDPAGISTLTQARRMVMDGAQANAVVADAQVNLPDVIPMAWRAQRYLLRYTVTLGPCGALPGAALSLFRVGAPYQAWVQGVPLLPVTVRGQRYPWLPSPALSVVVLETATPITYNGRMPTLLALPIGTHSVEIAFQSLPYMPAGLTVVQVGPTHVLLPHVVAMVNEIVGHADAASGVLLVLAIMALLLWLRRRNDRTLLWLAVACAAWGLRGVFYFGALVTYPALWFEQLNPLNVLITALALATSTLYFLGRPTPRQLCVVLSVAVVGLGAFALTAVLGVGAVYARVMSLLLSYGITLWLMLQIWRCRRKLTAWRTALLLLGLVAVLACAGHDLLIVSGHLAATVPSYLFWGFEAVLLGYMVIVGEYIVTTLSRAERSNDELEQRIADKSATLERSYQQLRESELAVERDAARAQERSRLVREMHDGLGAQLMTALRGVERGGLTPVQVAQSLQESLDDLRMLMDSSDKGHTLQFALANWRNRWDWRLQAAGLALDWQIPVALEELIFQGDTVLQIMRILQEAATNAVKHAQATVLRVQISSVAGQWRLEIEDNGKGLPDIGQATPSLGGRGLRNMQERAAKIHARLDMDSPPEPGGRGTRICLTLPESVKADV